MILRQLALALAVCGLALALPASAQTQGETMQKYVIERDIPDSPTRISRVKTILDPINGN